MTRSRLAAITGLAILLGLGFVVYRGVVGSATAGVPSPRPSASASAAIPTTAASASATATPGASVVAPSPSPTATPTPGPSLVPGPLDGLPVTEAAAEQHPIAVMIDDLSPARPQSGFSSASIVWQAPAEGGIPRYMMIFQSRVPKDVGPVRSARYYYIAWAAEWRAVYAHAGGSPQALRTLQAQGHGQLVYNADEFRYAATFRRISTRFSPHNLYTTGKQLRSLSKAIGAADGPIKAAWQFAPDAPLAARPSGGTIDVAYKANAIHYRYDRLTNTYIRSVSKEKVQHDASTGAVVAPKNVVVMLMHFGPLGDSQPQKHRLEADVIGHGTAWIATNGVTIKGTWRKASLTGPTQFYGPGGREVTLTAGQTFVQVMPVGSRVSIVAGRPAADQTRPSGLSRPD